MNGRRDNARPLSASDEQLLDRLDWLSPAPGWVEPGTADLVRRGLATVAATPCGDDVRLTAEGRRRAAQIRQRGGPRRPTTGAT